MKTKVIKNNFYFLDAIANGYVSEDSELPASNNVIIHYDLSSTVYLSNGTVFEIFIITHAFVDELKA